MRLTEQLRRHSLALISLLVALTALGYNTWRNELTERNRNIRHAGFEMMLHIAELQRITYLAHIDKDIQSGNPRKGEVAVLILRDLARLMPEFVQNRSQALLQVWRENWKGLGTEEDQAIAAIDNAINDLRVDVLKALDALD